MGSTQVQAATDTANEITEQDREDFWYGSSD